MIENDFFERNKNIVNNYIKNKSLSSFMDKYTNEIIEYLYNKFISIFQEDEITYNENMKNIISDYYNELRKKYNEYVDKLRTDIMENRSIKFKERKKYVDNIINILDSEKKRIIDIFSEKNKTIVDKYISKNFDSFLKESKDKIKNYLYFKYIKIFQNDEDIYNEYINNLKSEYYVDLERISKRKKREDIKKLENEKININIDNNIKNEENKTADIILNRLTKIVENRNNNFFNKFNEIENLENKKIIDDFSKKNELIVNNYNKNFNILSKESEDKIKEYLFDKFIPIIQKKSENNLNIYTDDFSSEYYKDLEEIFRDYIRLDFSNLQKEDIKNDFFKRNKILINYYIKKNFKMFSKEKENKIENNLYNIYISTFENNKEKYISYINDINSDYYFELYEMILYD